MRDLGPLGNGIRDTLLRDVRDHAVAMAMAAGLTGQRRSDAVRSARARIGERIDSGLMLYLACAYWPDREQPPPDWMLIFIAEAVDAARVRAAKDRTLEAVRAAHLGNGDPTSDAVLLVAEALNILAEPPVGANQHDFSASVEALKQDAAADLTLRASVAKTLQHLDLNADVEVLAQKIAELIKKHHATSKQQRKRARARQTPDTADVPQVSAHARPTGSRLLSSSTAYLVGGKLASRTFAPEHACVLASELEALCAGLSERERTAIAMRIEGYTHAEIGEALGRSESWVRGVVKEIDALR